ncbi:MAG: porin [Bacteroidetes bacterium]|nr:MAG: porin [Bacteroidota bacterium]
MLYLKDTVRPFLKRFENLQFSGYIQPQFQLADTEGAKSYDGGDFSTFSRSRFMLRRARIKLDYLLRTEDNYPKALFTFQVDATERGVNVRDMFMRLYETKWHNFSFTAGLFARPFGYEVNLSSAYRETPERGRMSQILMPTERDLGAMFTYEDIRREAKNKFIKFDAGLFNGQGLSGTTDFDSHKDLISRLTIKSIPAGKFLFSGGLSLLYGGWRQGTKYVYEMGTANGDKTFMVDSSLNNVGKISPRHYYGADVQIILKHAWGQTEWRAEYWRGQQPGTANSTTNPGTLPTVPTYRRQFDGAFFYFLQNIINNKNQLLVKYDWYDPNTKVSKNEIGKANTNLTIADVKYSTLGLGYAYYFNDHIKLILYYEFVKNEATQLVNYSSDQKDNVFTCRMQFRF